MEEETGKKEERCIHSTGSSGDQNSAVRPVHVSFVPPQWEKPGLLSKVQETRVSGRTNSRHTARAAPTSFSALSVMLFCKQSTGRSARRSGPRALANASLS